MKFHSTPTTLLLTVLLHLQPSLAQLADASIVGTWSSKSQKVLTGPGFYNPVDDRFIEPSLAGISYSFTADGWFEQAYYRAVANPTTPSCTSAVLQWQHGTYTIASNGSILLNPIGVDGRMQTSTPCSYSNSIYERWSQFELIAKYGVETDPFHNVPRLNLFQFDGKPLMPLYQIYNPPMMLPTQTLNPIASTASATAKAKVKRGESGWEQVALSVGEPLNKHALVLEDREWVSAESVWWAGIGLVLVGGAMYMYPSPVSREGGVAIK